jgi:hypothetical protein
MVHIFSLEGRNGNDLGKIMFLTILIHERKQFLFFDEIHFVNDQDHRLSRLLNPFQDKSIAYSGGPSGLHKKEDQIRTLDRLPGHLDHPVVELVLGFMDPGRIQQNQLRIRECPHPQDSMAGGLGCG